MSYRSLPRIAGGGVLAVAIAASAIADQKPAASKPAAPDCDAPEYRQFDFWVGHWDVSQGGKAVGRNQIEVDLKRCALFESWSSNGGSRGRSVNFYDRTRQRWHQSWIDDSGEPLHLDGGLVDGSMVLEGDTPGPNAAAVVHDRISWTPNRDGSVRQHWERRVGAATAWETVFDGLYRRAP